MSDRRSPAVRVQGTERVAAFDPELPFVSGSFLVSKLACFTRFSG